MFWLLEPDRALNTSSCFDLTHRNLWHSWKTQTNTRLTLSPFQRLSLFTVFIFQTLLFSETYPAFAFGHCKKNQFKIVSPSCNKWKTCPKRKWGPRLKQKVCLFCFGTLPEDCCQRKVTRVIINGSILFNYSIFYFLEPRAEIKEIPIRYKPPDIKALSEKTGLVKEYFCQSLYSVFWRFSPNTLRRLYRGFKTECPSGEMLEDDFKVVFSKFFPFPGLASSISSGSSLYAHYVFSCVDVNGMGIINFEV